MAKRLWFPAALVMAIAFAVGVLAVEPAQACGGFFCQNSPVDQNAERIIFTQNDDHTVSALIQIQYTGSAPDFSWILPLPEAIGPEDIEVPEDAMAAFTELEIATDPVFIAPPLPQCAIQPPMIFMAAAAPAADSVVVFASGEVGPYGFDVVGSEDPDALISWLRDNEYSVTPEMEPLIDVYVEEAFVFLAMQLLPDEGAQDVQPVKVTYPSERPMIPLRLTAVAANPNMAVMTWFYAQAQAVPINYAKIDIADTELVFFGAGASNNYRQLIGQKADEFAGQAFITEYAAPTHELAVVHPLLQELRDDYPYVTRLNTIISPEEMTIDPIFDYTVQLEDVSNVHDLSKLTGVYACERQGSPTELIQPATVGGPVASVSTQNQSTGGVTRPPSTESRPDDSVGQAATAAQPATVGQPATVEEAGGANEAPTLEAPAVADSDSSLPALGVGVAIGIAGLTLVGGLVALGMGLGRRARREGK